MRVCWETRAFARVCLVVCTVLVALLAVAGPGECYLRLHPSNPRYFQETSTGKPVLIETVTGIATQTDMDYIAQIDEMGARRISYTRVWHFTPWAGDAAVWPWGRSGVAGAPMGGNKIDMNSWNTFYWTRLKDAMSRANATGTYAEMMLFDRCGMSPASPTRWQGNPWASDNNINNLETPPASGDGAPDFYYYSVKPNLRNQQERYIRKMIDEMIAYPNVFFEIENEHWRYTDPAWPQHYSQFVKDYIAATYPNSPRLVSYSSLEVDMEDCYNIPTIDVVNQHFGKSATDPYLYNTYIESRWNRNKAINIDEFANTFADWGVLRKVCWTIVASGGNFHIEEAGPTARPFDVVENIRAFIALSGWDFIHAAPNKSLVTDGQGFCMAQPGVEYVFYLLAPTNGNSNRSLALASGNYRAAWWNTRTGAFSSNATFTHGGGNKTFTMPSLDDWILHVTTQAAPEVALESKRTTGVIAIDGDPADWNVSSLTTRIAGGDAGTGNVAVIGYDGVVCYAGGRWMSGQFAPTDATDHSAKVYSKNDDTYIYFLARMNDSDIRSSFDPANNNLNDCVEFDIDPGHNGGTGAISGSTSDVRLVIDAANQKNAYGVTSGYASQILGGVSSAVSRDSSGWWLEARIAKSAFSPALPSTGTIGLDLCFRDNDFGNDPTKTTVYTWADPEYSSAAPTFIPDRWGELKLVGPPDTTVPGPVTNLTASAGDQQVTLSWTNPTDPDVTGAMVRYKTTGYPLSLSDGTLLVDKLNSPGANDSFAHAGIANGTTCYYSVFAHDAEPNYSTAAQAQATPLDIWAPATVTNFAAIAADGQVQLSWTNPATADFAATTIRCKTTGYPTGPTDGMPVCSRATLPGSSDTYSHSGLTNGALYYYAAFAYDEVPLYSPAAQVNARPVAGSCFSEAFTYPNGKLSGNSGWSGAGNTEIQVVNGTVKITGGTGYFEAVKSASCSGNGGIIWTHVKVQKGVGGATMWGVWFNDTNGVNLARWYGYGTTAAGRTGGTNTVTSSQNLTGGWDDLAARINTAANTTEYFFNGVSLGTLSHYMLNNYAGDSVGGVRLERIDNVNAAGHHVYVDSLLIGQIGVTPPGPVTDFSAICGNTRNTLSWTNPASQYFSGTMLRYKAAGYPANASDGTLLCIRPNTPGSSDGYTHEGLVNGAPCYYSAFAYDEASNYSTAANRSATPAYIDPAQAKMNPDDPGATVIMTEGVVTAAWPNDFYARSPTKPVGLHVRKDAHGLNIGDAIGARGFMMTDADGERYLLADWAESHGTGNVSVFAAGNASLGGVDWNYNTVTKAGQRGVAPLRGANNVGLLARVWGKVTQRDMTDLAYFYIDDGSGLLDGTDTEGEANVGLRVMADPRPYAQGSYVLVTGISSCFYTSGSQQPRILPRTGEIRVMSP